MAHLVVTCLCFLAVCVLVNDAAPVGCPALEEVKPRPQPRPRRQYERYTTRYERINVDRVLSSKRLVRNYVECMLDRKPCPPDGAELKKILPDHLHNNCSRCTQKQKVGLEKAMEKLSKDYKEEWLMLLDRYDPDMSYRKRLLEKEGGPAVDNQPTVVQTP
ncbi:ejaculatory bulb-specific protein 3-like [Ischnura elegans]|uniref:ejaculatory bulb-specific protein 3-like n=1 Tax=Ischnura elegans TaxID=197161 RepID=UPI001ED8B4B7|nr:ejaculatory bulb-specific protein 3-like [Ischnura elegans]